MYNFYRDHTKVEENVNLATGMKEFILKVKYIELLNWDLKQNRSLPDSTGEGIIGQQQVWKWVDG